MCLSLSSVSSTDHIDTLLSHVLLLTVMDVGPKSDTEFLKIDVVLVPVSLVLFFCPCGSFFTFDVGKNSVFSIYLNGY